MSVKWPQVNEYILSRALVPNILSNKPLFFIGNPRFNSPILLNLDPFSFDLGQGKNTHTLDRNRVGRQVKLFLYFYLAIQDKGLRFGNKNFGVSTKELKLVLQGQDEWKQVFFSPEWDVGCRFFLNVYTIQGLWKKVIDKHKASKGFKLFSV